MGAGYNARMRRLWRRLLIILAVLGSAHAYIWWRLVRAPGWPAPWFSIATVVVFAMAPALPTTMFFVRRF